MKAAVSYAALLNLVVNAIKSTPEGGSVSVTLRRASGAWSTSLIENRPTIKLGV